MRSALALVAGTIAIAGCWSASTTLRAERPLVDAGAGDDTDPVNDGAGEVGPRDAEASADVASDTSAFDASAWCCDSVACGYPNSTWACVEQTEAGIVYSYCGQRMTPCNGSSCWLPGTTPDAGHYGNVHPCQ
jgi:hypothetical protein